MKILHIGKYFHPAHGGIESFLMDLARESARQGVRQGILVHAQPGQPAAPVDPAAYPYLDYFDRVATYGSFSYAPISPGFPSHLRRAVARFQPDLLHLHLPNPSTFWALLSTRARRIPWLIHWHADAVGPELERLLRFLYIFYRPFEQALLDRADQVIVSSLPYLQGSPALEPWSTHCRVVPLGLDSQRIQPRSERQVSPGWDRGEALRILTVGRLTPYKGLDVLIRAIATTRASIVIVGEGPQRAVLEPLITQLGIEQRVHLLGAVSDAERNFLLSQCDLVCLPSLNRAEAFGISVLEAMAMGKPALVSRLEGSGLPWLVEDGRTGWHVQPGDVEALAAKIDWLDKNRDAISASGRRAAQRYRECFEIERVTRRIIEIQSDILQARRRKKRSNG